MQKSFNLIEKTIRTEHNHTNVLVQQIHEFVISINNDDSALDTSLFRQCVEVLYDCIQSQQYHFRVISALCQLIAVVLSHDSSVTTDNSLLLEKLVKCIEYCFQCRDIELNWFDSCCDLYILIFQSMDEAHSENKDLMVQLLDIIYNKLIQDIEWIELLNRTLNYSICSNTMCRTLIVSNSTSILTYIRNSIELQLKDKNISYDLCHILYIIFTERIGCEPTLPITCDFLVQLVIRGTDPDCIINEDLYLESLQFLYMASQSLIYQSPLALHAETIAQNCLRLLQNNELYHIQYFVLKMFREWMDEASDHLIVTQSVKQIVNILLDQRHGSISTFASVIIPLCSSHQNIHARVQSTAIQLINDMTSMLCTTSRNMV
jgi:hypothetical protein